MDLYPVFAQELTVFESRLLAARLPFHRFCGYRSFEQQAAEYAKGRTVPGAIVTKAKPGQSRHQYAIAADYVLDGMLEKPGVQWSWDIKADLNKDGANDWRQMAQLAKECGLEAGYFWQAFPDAPHVELPVPLKTFELQALYDEGGLPRVFAEFDKIFKMAA